MDGFIKVFDGGYDRLTSTEIIRIEDLIKVYKWLGSSGDGICFEWHCPTRKNRRQWVYICPSVYRRDEMFDKYERILTGECISVP